MLLVIASKVITLTILFIFGSSKAFSNHLLLKLPAYFLCIVAIQQDHDDNVHKAADELWCFTWTAPDQPIGLVSSLCGDMSHNTAQKTQPGCHWVLQFGLHSGIQTGTHPLSQSVLCKSAPSSEHTKNHFCACQYLFCGRGNITDHVIVEGNSEKRATDHQGAMQPYPFWAHILQTNIFYQLDS